MLDGREIHCTNTSHGMDHTQWVGLCILPRGYTSYPLTHDLLLQVYYWCLGPTVYCGQSVHMGTEYSHILVEHVGVVIRMWWMLLLRVRRSTVATGSPHTSVVEHHPCV